MGKWAVSIFGNRVRYSGADFAVEVWGEDEGEEYLLCWIKTRRYDAAYDIRLTLNMAT